MTNVSTKSTREEIALREVGHTHISSRLSWTLTLVFFVSIVSVPGIQYLREIDAYRRDDRTSAWPSSCLIFKSIPASITTFRQTLGSLLHKIQTANRQLLRDMDRYETSLTEESWLTDQCLGPTQWFLTRFLRAGNEEAYPGDNGWLFYRPGIDYLTGPGFLDEAHLAQPEALGDTLSDPIHPNPLPAILDFHEQLAQRGIRLIVVPTPVKPMIHPEKFSSRYGGPNALPQNPSYATFIKRLEREGILIFDPAPLLHAVHAKSDSPQFLQTDTHWTFSAMTLAAEQLAEYITRRVELPGRSQRYQRLPLTVTNSGDIANMLRLPASRPLYPRKQMAIQQVLTDRNELWKPDPQTDILLLGDSFSNIYSLEGMGWGTAAGFAEQLSHALQRPVDALLRNDAGAFATRELLGREMARGRDRLAGKRIVIWQFSDRELTASDWKLIDVALGKPKPTLFFSLPPGEEMDITGTLFSVSSSVKPGTVPYTDNIITLHVVDIQGPRVKDQGSHFGGPGPQSESFQRNNQALVYMWGMRTNQLTRASRYRPGDTVRLTLKPWMDVEDQYGSYRRSALDDEEIELEEPCWGEEVSL